MVAKGLYTLNSHRRRPVDTIAFWAICAIAIIAAAFASWRVITKARYTKVVAKNNSIASGNNTIINHKDDESPQGEG